MKIIKVEIKLFLPSHQILIITKKWQEKKKRRFEIINKFKNSKFVN